MMTLTFAAPEWLWALAAPAALALVWLWRVHRRRRDLRVLHARRLVPVRERFRAAGDLTSWGWLLPAIACLMLALARPQTTTTTVQRPGVDLVVLQDASASMHVTDVAPNRWQRSMHLLRALGDALSWREDRLALTVFAHIAAPQVRLTRDPNTFFFFLDHLHARPPFRLEDDTTWDTNLELGIGWGLRLIRKDEEIHGRSANARAFVVLSDGETWSGEVAQALAETTRAQIPLFVIGVGTLQGGRLPSVVTIAGSEMDAEAPLVSRLDRQSLQRLASAGGGQYFELGRESDHEIASAILSTVRRSAAPSFAAITATDIYWWFLAAAAALAALSLLFVRDTAGIALLLTGAIAGLVVLMV